MREPTRSPAARGAARLLPLLALAGGPSAQGDAPAGEEPAVVVEMTDTLRYAPEEAHVHVGDTVQWTNPSQAMHTVTADASLADEPETSVRLPEGAEPFDSGEIDPGESWSRTFDVEGRYVYFCIPHELAGMVGTLVVHPEGSDLPGGRAGPPAK